MKILFIWLSGIILAYYAHKKYILNLYTYKDWGWSDVFFNMLVSLFSWLIIILLNIPKIKIKFPKPPRWL